MGVSALGVLMASVKLANANTKGLDSIVNVGERERERLKVFGDTEGGVL